MSHVIDRRLNGKNKSTVNRQRFLRRYRDHIKKAVEEAVSRRSITDMEHGEQISIPGRDIDEPVLHHGRGGKQTIVHPGNKEFTAGEHIPRPQGGGGGGGGGAVGAGARSGSGRKAGACLSIRLSMFFGDHCGCPTGIRQFQGDSKCGPCHPLAEPATTG